MGEMINFNAPRCFDDLLTSAGTRSSTEYARPGSNVVQLKSYLRQKVGGVSSVLHQSEATRNRFAFDRNISSLCESL
ncbi:hypothetical protein MTR67_019311 [Solanum verrucosum]|uniref:Uncharacterized protein n=1 Tax=Solanum verrucosum TaxID=315347 RepID=A0AAF0TN53_SOLVR|nr:hypothetical protein MTR67_019311 [Solanum verrucosum]